MLECLNIFLLSVKALVGYVGTFKKEKEKEKVPYYPNIVKIIMNFC